MTRLDVGAGTGLLTLGARQRFGASSVVACDVSRDALLHLRRVVDHDPIVTAVWATQGNATHLPFESQSFDAVVARSVLIYVDDKRAAASEIYRVLRPSGRVSIFEPINAAPRQYGHSNEDVLDDLRPGHEAVRASFERHSEHWHSMMDFDERDLTHCFTAAGFTAVGLVYELLDITYPMSEAEARQSIAMRGNPTAPTWAEAAYDALGPAADDYLRRLIEFRTGRPTRTVNAVTYLTATRP